MIFDVHPMQVKQPDKSKYLWYYLQRITMIPGNQAFRRPADSGCPFVNKT